jgi:hypothetical protein
MEKEFIPYEQALDLKELGFDEPCFGLYENGKLGYSFSTSKVIITPISYRTNSKFVEHILTKEDCTAPTFSQAFRWFREKYNLFGYSYPNDYQMYGYRIVELKSSENKELIYDWGTLNTHEEAELACLKKLIEIVKQKRKI